MGRSAAALFALRFGRPDEFLLATDGTLGRVVGGWPNFITFESLGSWMNGELDSRPSKKGVEGNEELTFGLIEICWSAGVCAGVCAGDCADRKRGVLLVKDARVCSGEIDVLMERACE